MIPRRSYLATSSGPSMIPRSPASRTPLISSVADPGHRLSLSTSSYDSQPSLFGYAGPTGMPTSTATFSTSTRYGPSVATSQPVPGPSWTSGSMHGPGYGHAYGGDCLESVDEDDLDDPLHTLTPVEKRNASVSSPFDITSVRGWTNSLTVAVLACALVCLFAAYPIIAFYADDRSDVGAGMSGYNLGGVNASGQYPVIPGWRTLIDPDTPEELYTRTGFDGNQWRLTFSDEFNKGGRTFYPGDDPFWEAMDLHYWPTGDFEWYDPSAVTTRDGHLVITITQQPTNGLNFKSGMIQSWNKLCFNKNAYFEVAATFPGTNNVGGFWPAVWTMGNLGRPGYGATTDGMWPYSYDSCDVGILPNQTYLNGTGPAAALTTGTGHGPLSYLPGQRTPSCTCEGEDHPGPSVDVGRSSPEIDLIEAQIRLSIPQGEVSQSAQVAPYDDYYQFDNLTSGATDIYDPDLTMFNTYLGGYYQQAVSGLSLFPNSIYANQSLVDGTQTEFHPFGFEYQSDQDDRSKGYIEWVAAGKRVWRMNAAAVGPNPRTEVGQRLVSEEPMAVIMNLAMSNNFQAVDFAHLYFPNEMRIDYIRVWQRETGTIGCDPDDHPTAAYIERHKDIYNNRNLTTWEGAGQAFPRNRLTTGCS